MGIAEQYGRNVVTLEMEPDLKLYERIIGLRKHMKVTHCVFNLYNLLSLLL